MIVDMAGAENPLAIAKDYVDYTKLGWGEEEINTCIACNQACLDHTFQARRASCLVNPRAGYETELHLDAPAAAVR